MDTSARNTQAAAKTSITRPGPDGGAFAGEFFQKTLDALEAHIAILDEHGQIIAVNSTWNAFATSNDLATDFCGPGANYLSACDNAQGECSDEAHAVSQGIRAVIAGVRPFFYLEYPCHSPQEQRWFSVRITRFEIDGRARAVVTHDNITKRKLAELQLLSINRGLQQQTRIDALTGIGNRRMFDTEYEQQWKLHQQNGQPLSLALIDVDFFKQYNDALGHVKGDECLKSVAESIRASVLWPGAQVTRYGGEEFAIILPGADTEEARVEVEAVRRAVLALQIPHPRSAANRFVTVSIGSTTCLPREQDSPAEFLHRADLSLYRAKSSGRNQALHDSGETSLDRPPLSLPPNTAAALAPQT